MSQTPDTRESIAAGETASIENTQGSALSISLCSEGGCKVEIELAPGQVLGFTAGDANATLVLHHGDPTGLRVIKPSSVT